jgi:sugar lactone lactonase YvrE
MNLFRIATGVVVLLAQPLGAQFATGIPAVDSASVARAAFARAAAALRRDDSTTARIEIGRAAESWPLQPAYLWTNAVFSARAHDSATAFDALRRYASLGLGRDLRTETAFDWLRSTASFAKLIAVHDSNHTPANQSRVVLTLPDSTFWPEGVDFDAHTRRYYVASVAHRTIVEARADGSTRELIARDRRDLSAVLGVRVDATHGVMWATTSAVRASPGFATGDSIGAELLRIRLSDGTIERRWAIAPRTEGHMLGDLAVGPRGDVFFTDSNDPVLYRLRPGSDTIESIRSPLFRSLQGIAPLPDGRAIIVADYSHGLLRIDVERRKVIRLDDAPHTTSIGCDGIAWDRGAVVAVQNGVAPARVMRFVLDANVTRILRADLLDRSTGLADEPTIGTIVGHDFVYVANSQWEKYDDTGRRVLSRRLAAPVLLAVPLP